MLNEALKLIKTSLALNYGCLIFWKYIPNESIFTITGNEKLEYKLTNKEALKLLGIAGHLDIAFNGLIDIFKDDMNKESEG